MRFLYDYETNFITDSIKQKHINMADENIGKLIQQTLNEQQDTIDDLNEDIKQLNTMLNDTESQLIYQLEKLAAALKARGRG